MIKNTTVIEIDNDIFNALFESAKDFGYDNESPEFLKEIVTEMVNNILKENIEDTWA